MSPPLTPDNFNRTQAISANISGEGGISLHKILTITCLTFHLLLTYRPILAPPEYELKVVNICEMDGTGCIKVPVLCAFDWFQQYVEIAKKKWWKSAITFLLCNIMTSKTQIRC